MLKMEFGVSRSGTVQFYPCFYCDWCNERIKQGQKGVFHYWNKVLVNFPTDTSLTVTHLGDCAKRYSAQAHQEKEDYAHGTEYLSELIGYLGSSLAMDWEPIIQNYGPSKYRKPSKTRKAAEQE